MATKYGDDSNISSTTLQERCTAQKKVREAEANLVHNTATRWVEPFSRIRRRFLLHRIGVKIFGRIFVLFCIFLLGLSAALVLRRTISVISGVRPLARVSALDSSPIFVPSRALGLGPSDSLNGNLAPHLVETKYPRAPQRLAFANGVAMAGRAVILDGSNYAWTDAGFSAGLAAAGVNGSVLLPQGAVVTLTSEHVISTDGVSVNCAPGAGFVSGANEINLITITGASDEVLGCHFWAGSGPDSDPLFLWNSTGARIEGNTALGFTGIRVSFVYLVGAQSSTIQSNQCIAGPNGAGCIFGEKGAIGTTVQSNDLDLSRGADGAHAIAFHSTEPGRTVSETKILDNRIMAGPGYCVEVGAFGGDVPQGLVISANTCKMTTDGLGGYSIGSSAKFWTVSNNTFDANGFRPSISCVEVAAASDGTVVGNSCDGGNISLSNAQAQRVTVSSNLIYDLRDQCAAIYLGTSVAGGVVNDNLVIGNLIHLPVGMAAIGIWQQCNAPGATCDDNRYSYNTIVSDGSAGSIGIKFENDYGVSNNESVGPNTFRRPAVSFDPVGRVSFTNTQIDTGYVPPFPPVGPPSARPGSSALPQPRIR